MVVRRSIWLTSHTNNYVLSCIAVYADEPYQPLRTIQKPKIYGVQSALVVGPQGKEIYVDEFGRVRVQFAWDREGKFDENSSCWMRVSHPSAGGAFGFVAHPRVGHEVLVGFFEGDPDQPIIVGRVYNSTATGPLDGTTGETDPAKRPPGYFPATSADVHGDNWTKSGFRTDSSPHSDEVGGYNELMFQDAIGKELVHIQAERDLTVVVKRDERHDVKSMFQIIVGEAGGPSTRFTMTENSIELSSGNASFTIADDWVAINGKKQICLHAGNTFHISSTGLIDMNANQIDIDTIGNLNLNCGEANTEAPSAPEPGKAHPGHEQPPPFLPEPSSPLPEPPGGIIDVTVGCEKEDEDKARAEADKKAKEQRRQKQIDAAASVDVAEVPADAPVGAAALQTVAQVGSAPSAVAAMENAALADRLRQVNMALNVVGQVSQVASLAMAVAQGGLGPAALGLLTGFAENHVATMVPDIVVPRVATSIFTPPFAGPTRV